MFESENLSCDVLVVGTGIAGIRAAMVAKAEGLDVLLISKGPIASDSCSYYAGGGFRANQWLEYFTLEGDLADKEDVIGDEWAVQRYLSDPELVGFIAQEAQKDVEDLISFLELPMVKHRRPGKYFVDRKKLDQQSGPGAAIIMLPMARKAREMGIVCLDRVMATDLVTSEGRIKGALAVDKQGKLLKIGAKAVVMATGGGGDAYEHSSNPGGVVGDGYVLALRQGLVLQNMEIVEFHALGIEGNLTPPRRITPGVITGCDGAVMVNGKGEDIVQKHLKMTLRRAIDIPVIKLEILPLIIAQEARSSDGAYIDLTRISPKDWDKILSNPFQKAYFSRAPYLRQQRWPLQPVAHGFDGGVKINLRCETAVPGLFAAGQVVGAHAGVSYPLSRCLSMGVIAGGNVVSFVKQNSPAPLKEGEWHASLSRIKGLVGTGGTADPGELKQTIRGVIYTAGGPLRDGPGLEKGIRDLDALEERVNSMRVESPSQVKDALEAQNILLVGKAVLGAAWRRKESRGPHFRSDFPQKDNNWFKRILISMDKKDSRLVFSEEEILARPA